MANILIDSFKQELSLYRTNKLLVLQRLTQPNRTTYEVRLYPNKRIAIKDLPRITNHAYSILNLIMGEQLNIEANRFGLCFTAIITVNDLSDSRQERLNQFKT